MDFHAIPKDIILKAFKDKAFFVSTFLFNPDRPTEPIKPYDYQVKELNSTSRFKVLRQGRQSGKTLVMAEMALIDMIMNPNYHIMFIGPNEHHVARFWDEKLRPLITNSIFKDSIVVDRKSPMYQITLDNGSFIQGYVGNSDKTVIRGQSVDHLIVDECFDKYTKVITDKGVKTLSEIRAGDIVLDASGKYTKVLVSKSTGIKDVYPVNADIFTIPLYATPDHPFLYNGKWVSLKNINEMSLFIGVHQEVISIPMVLAFNYVYLLNDFDNNLLSISVRDKNLVNYVSMYVKNFRVGFKNRHNILDKVYGLSDSEKIEFLRIIMRFLAIIPRELVDLFRDFGYTIKYDSLDFESSDKFMNNVGLFGDMNGYGKITYISDKLGINPSDLLDEDTYHYDIANAVIRIPIEKGRLTKRVVWNLKTESGTYMVYHDGYYIPVHNCDYLHENKWTEINGSLIARPNHKKTIASTPSPKRGMFYRACTDKSLGFEEFHIPSTMRPDWTWIKDAERLGIPKEETSEYIYRKAFYMKGDWEREVMAEFFDFEEAVIPGSKIDKSFENYIDTSEKLGPRIMGVDWNGNVHGIVMVILEWMKSENKYRVVYTETVSHNEYNHSVALERMKRLLHEYNYDFLYVDYGYGEQDVEMLMRMGDELNIPVFKEVYRVRFNEDIKVMTNFGTMKYMLKEFIINHTAELFRSEYILLPADQDDRISLTSQDTLGYQFRNLIVTRITPNGHVIYFVEPDHLLAAFLCALYGFVNEYQPIFDPMTHHYHLDVKDVSSRGVIIQPVLGSTGDIYGTHIVDRSNTSNIYDRGRTDNGIIEVNTLDDFLKA